MAPALASGQPPNVATRFGVDANDFPLLTMGVGLLDDLDIMLRAARRRLALHHSGHSFDGAPPPTPMARWRGVVDSAVHGDEAGYPPAGDEPPQRFEPDLAVPSLVQPQPLPPSAGGGASGGAPGLAGRAVRSHARV